MVRLIDALGSLTRLQSCKRILVCLPMMWYSLRHAALTPLRSNQSAIPGCRILIIDDTRAAGYVLGRLLEKIRQQVCAATDATGASVRHERPDVVISDIGMPNIDGYELARWLRKEPDSDRLITHLR